MCQYCFGERECDHGSGHAPGAPCACSRAGPSRCPECGCECAPWYTGLGFVGPGSVRSFFGVGDDENPGFSAYPASKAQIVAAAREELQEAEADMADVGWLAGNLPETTFHDLGDVCAALTPVVAFRERDSSAVVAVLPMQAVASGTRLVVGDAQLAALVASDGRVLDSFGTGEYVLSRETAPHATAASRPPAPGFSKSAINAVPVFASARGIQVSIRHGGHTRTGESVSVRGTITVVVTTLSDLLPNTGSHPRGLSETEFGAEVTRVLGDVLDRTFAAHPVADLTSSGGVVEAAVRAGVTAAGLRVSALNLDPVAQLSAVDQMAAIQDRQRQAMANMPPEMQARIAEQMAKAMERRQATGGAGLPVPRPGSTGPNASATRDAARSCPQCHAPNPPEVKFCGNCGQALPSKSTCPACGKEALPGVKFCGSCGARLP